MTLKKPLFNMSNLTNDIKRARAKLKLFEEKGFTQIVNDVVSNLHGIDAPPVNKVVEAVNLTRAGYEKEIETMVEQQNKFVQSSINFE
jgi:hypothetical protein